MDFIIQFVDSLVDVAQSLSVKAPLQDSDQISFPSRDENRDHLEDRKELQPSVHRGVVREGAEQIYWVLDALLQMRRQLVQTKPNVLSEEERAIDDLCPHGLRLTGLIAHEHVLECFKFYERGHVLPFHPKVRLNLLREPLKALVFPVLHTVSDS